MFLFVSHATADNAFIRPIIVKLVTSGIPVWFDKPDSLLLPDHIRSGVTGIPFGMSWKETIEEAIERAGAFVRICSHAAHRSFEVNQEAGYARAQWRRLGKSYGYGSLFLHGARPDAADHTAFGDQGLEIHYETDWQNGWPVLTPNTDAALDRLIEWARPLVDAGRPRRIMRSASRQRDPRPFLVDRRRQRAGVEEELLRQRTTNKRPSVLAIGEESQLVDSFFRDAIRMRVLPKLDRGEIPDADEYVLRLSWPATKDPALFADALRHELAYEVRRVCHAKCLPNDVSIAEALAQAGLQRAVLSVIKAETWEASADRRRVVGWLKYWDEFPFSSLGGADLFAALALELPNGHASEVSLALRNGLKAAISEFSGSRPFRLRNTGVVVLEPLDHVTRTDMVQWVDDDPLLRGEDHELRDNLKRKLEPIFMHGDVDMSHWASHARLVLAEACPV